jgi:hypothetical protein
MNPEFFEDVVGVAEHIHQVRDRGALIASDVRHTRLQERLGDCQNAFAAKFLAGAELEFLDFFFERSFRHRLLRLIAKPVTAPQRVKTGKFALSIGRQRRFTSVLSLKLLAERSRRSNRFASGGLEKAEKTGGPV